jgi:superfamily II DNA/RNA helicase
MINLVKTNKIICEGDDTIHPVSNFTKLIRKFNIDDNLVQTMKLSGFVRPTPIQMIAIPAFFKVKIIFFFAKYFLF